MRSVKDARPVRSPRLQLVSRIDAEVPRHRKSLVGNTLSSTGATLRKKRPAPRGSRTSTPVPRPVAVTRIFPLDVHWTLALHCASHRPDSFGPRVFVDVAKGDVVSQGSFLMRRAGPASRKRR